MTMLEKLTAMRSFGGEVRTRGLDDETLQRFAQTDDRMAAAVDAAYAEFQRLQKEAPELMALPESELTVAVQEGFVNFYPADAVNPYVALAGSGPWVVTSRGAVLYECGGYGMLGLGHAPERLLEAMNRPHVMANIMTPTFNQKRLVDALRKEVGNTRNTCPYENFFCLNSGSEAVTLAARISDINARIKTDPGGDHAGQSIRILGLKSAFHGRTDRPARFSDSSRAIYCKYLASFRDHDNLLTVEPNNLEQLEQVFEYADYNRLFIESFFIEPVMGEGRPGLAITTQFYSRARELTKAQGTLLLVDSIQAGLRTHGVLSICDYPGFENLEAPDMETWSKALNGGQYPLSVLALNGKTAELYRAGVYGNTMTSNPRALDIAVAVLDSITPELRQNIKDRGRELIEKLTGLQQDLGGSITRVQGTGLLLSAELDPQRFKSYGAGSTEEYIRMRGINVIHGGRNALRYTPPFDITSAEVDLIIEATRDAIVNGPVKKSAETESAAA
ncbi:MAG: aminotransferase class III-fold pyridoxal phosphate-dependent enzyme [Gammaproteobacteria bacterium]|nr:MAG: aminotransferase class III-fold pyridoxal phosphate-dependent enzyme [Gammaproteobacteria bacterium]